MEVGKKRNNIIVIICAHNEEKILPSCLTSLVKQSVPLHEVIVVDDRSSDQTYKIARLYQDFLPLTVIKRKPDMKGRVNMKLEKRWDEGMYAEVFNDGLKSSDFKFDYLAKIDADFRLERTYFEKIIHAFRSDMKLGITGGMTINEPRIFHVRGGSRVFRRKCWDEISNNGFMPLISPEDVYLTAKARYKCWKVVQTREAKCINLRPFKKLNFHSRMKRRIDCGWELHVLGFHPLYFLWHVVRVATLRTRGAPAKVPFVAVVPMLFGWIKRWWKKERKNIEPEFKGYLKEVQLKELKNKILELLRVHSNS